MLDLSAKRATWPCSLAGLLILGLGLASCDSTHPNEITGQVFVQGTVTAADGHASLGIDGATAIDGATITAQEVLAQGVLGELWGSATSDDDSEFVLTMQPSGNVVILTAERDGFRAAVMLEEGVAAGHFVDGFITAPPMSLESTAEADVLVQARRQSQHILVADVSALVAVGAGKALAEDGTTVVKLASGIVAGALSEVEYARRPGGGSMTDVMIAAARDERRDAFTAFRTELAEAPTIEARASTVESFQRRYGSALAYVGLTSLRQAQASITAVGGIDRFAGVVHPRARYGSIQGAAEIAVINAATAIEEAFMIAGAPASRVATLGHARGSLVSAVRQANTMTEFEAAIAAYSEVIRLELAGELNLPLQHIDDAFQAVTLPRNTLKSALSSAADQHAIANAYVAYFNAAHEAVTAQLGSGSGLAADVIPLVSAF